MKTTTSITKSDKKIMAKGKSNKLILIVPLVATLIMAGCSTKKDQNSKQANAKAAKATSSTSQSQKSGSSFDNSDSKAILGYMAKKNFINDDFTRQVTGTQVKLEGYDLDEDVLYFSIASNGYDNSILSRITRYPGKVEFAKLDKDKNVLVLGTKIYTAHNRYLFRFPAVDFTVRKDATVEVDLDGISYTISVSELVKYIENTSIYGGMEGIELGGNLEMVNCAAYVSKPGEASLKRLISQIMVDADSKISNEDKAQLMLDFVTSRIKNDFDAHSTHRERSKRASEVLLTKKGDCNEKTVLYASLLEQLGINYILVYFGNHVAVAVEGDFSDENNLTFTYRKKSYTIAETTCSGFILGKTIAVSTSSRGQEILSIKAIRYVQLPAKDQRVFDAKGELIDSPKID